MGAEEIYWHQGRADWAQNKDKGDTEKQHQRSSCSSSRIFSGYREWS